MSKVWFITGAGSGIGTGTAKAALRSGDRVVATGRNLEKVRNVFPSVAQENIAFVQLDVADESKAKAGSVDLPPGEYHVCYRFEVGADYFDPDSHTRLSDLEHLAEAEGPQCGWGRQSPTNSP